MPDTQGYCKVEFSGGSGGPQAPEMIIFVQRLDGYAAQPPYKKKCATDEVPRAPNVRGAKKKRPDITADHFLMLYNLVSREGLEPSTR